MPAESDKNNESETYLYDTRFEFGKDNPFLNDIGREKLQKLKRYIKEHTDDFTEIDYLEDSRYLIMKPNTE